MSTTTGAPIQSNHRAAVRENVAELLAKIAKLEDTISNFDGDGDSLVLSKQINEYIEGLKAIHSLAPTLQQQSGEPYELPAELLRYVDDGGNPDLFLRDVVRSTVASNQRSKGKVVAFRQLYENLLQQLETSFPDEIQQYTHNLSK